MFLVAIDRFVSALDLCSSVVFTVIDLADSVGSDAPTNTDEFAVVVTFFDNVVRVIVVVGLAVVLAGVESSVPRNGENRSGQRVCKIICTIWLTFEDLRAITFLEAGFVVL